MLLYKMEEEASKLYNGCRMDRIHLETKRVVGVSVKALNGDGKRHVARRERDPY